MSKLRAANLPADLKWAQRNRFVLLEARVIWAGAVAPQNLCETFGISAAQADKDLALYQQLCPPNLRYDLRAKHYVAADRFEPAFLQGTAHEFLQVLRNHRVTPELPLAIVAASVAPVEVLEPPEREFDVRILQRVTYAIRDKRMVAVEYQSMSQPEPRRRLEIAPHALAYTGRWHTRAWSFAHKEFRDFLLSRMRGLPELEGSAGIQAAEDWQWARFVNVKIGAHPGLSTAQKKVVEADYGMRQGLLEKPVRLALLPYYLRLLSLGRDDHLRPAAEQQIVLLNRAELDAYNRLA